MTLMTQLLKSTYIYNSYIEVSNFLVICVIASLEGNGASLGISGGNAVIWQTRHTQFPLPAHGTLAKTFLGGGARNWVAVEILKINDNLAATVKLMRPVFVFRDLLN